MFNLEATKQDIRIGALMVSQYIKDARMSYMWAIVLLTTGAISLWYPQQLGVLLVKVNSLAVGAVLGYWLDRLTFPYARPDCGRDDRIEISYMYRRAALMAACVIGLAVAL
jgi:hypothetical protein